MSLPDRLRTGEQQKEGAALKEKLHMIKPTMKDSGPPRRISSWAGMLALVGLVLTLWLSGIANAQAAPLHSVTDRIYGTDRVDTAIKIAEAGWTRADTVLLARADDFPDSLVAVPLSHRLNAPILLTYPDKLDPRVLTEIHRLGAGHVIILGGEGALGSVISQSLQQAGLTWERIGGQDRYQTAALIADRLGANGQVILTSGENFPDALAISPYAGVTETPILLTTAKAVPQATLDELKKLEPNAQANGGEGQARTLVIGGTGVISDASLQGIPGIQRIAGQDRYETAAKVYLFAAAALGANTTGQPSTPPTTQPATQPTSQASAGAGVNHAFLVTGENFPDALVTGALAAKEAAPVFMSTPQTLPAVTYSAMGNAADNGLAVTLIGGPAVLSNTVEGIVEGKIQPPYLLGGVTIALDPGHGGADSGAVGPAGTMEKNNTLAVGLDLADILRSAGATVVMTRTTDVPPTGSAYSELPDLEARVKIADTAKADLFVSIHNDSFSNPAVGGTTTYYSSDNPQATQSLKLAQDIQAQAVEALGLQNRGVKEAPFYVIKHTLMPAVLIELAFISNPNEEKLLSSPDFRSKAAYGIYRGILVYKGF